MAKDGQFSFMNPFGGLEATQAVHLRLIGVDFLFVIIELFTPSASFCHNSRV